MIDHALEILSHQEIPNRITLSVHWLFLWYLCHPVYWSALMDIVPWTSVTLKILELSNILRDQGFRENLWGNWKPWKETIELRCLPRDVSQSLVWLFCSGSQFVSSCKKPHEELHDKTRLFKAELVQMMAVCICARVVLQKLQNILLKVLCKMLVFPSIAHYSSLQILHQSSLYWKVVLYLAC